MEMRLGCGYCVSVMDSFIRGLEMSGIAIWGRIVEGWVCGGLGLLQIVLMGNGGDE